MNSGNSTTDIVAAPLAWPEKWLHMSDIDKMFRGMPLVGIQRRVRRMFRRQLKLRNQRHLAAWGQDTATWKTLYVISPMIMEYMLWPNVYYLPDDPCDILLWDSEFIGHSELLDVALLLAIQDELHLPEHLLDDVYRMKYGELIAAVAPYVRLEA